LSSPRAALTFPFILSGPLFFSPTSFLAIFSSTVPGRLGLLRAFFQAIFFFPWIPWLGNGPLSVCRCVPAFKALVFFPFASSPGLIFPSSVVVLESPFDRPWMSFFPHQGPTDVTSPFPVPPFHHFASLLPPHLTLSGKGSPVFFRLRLTCPGDLGWLLVFLVRRLVQEHLPRFFFFILTGPPPAPVHAICPRVTSSDLSFRLCSSLLRSCLFSPYNSLPLFET